MADCEVLPPGAEPGWAVRANTSEIEAFLTARVAEQLRCKGDFGDAMLAQYAKQAMEAGGDGTLGVDQGVASTIASLLSGRRAASRGRSNSRSASAMSGAGGLLDV